MSSGVNDKKHPGIALIEKMLNMSFPVKYFIINLLMEL